MRWNSKVGDNIETPKIDAFLAEIVAICKKHGFSIGHEDRHGAFEVSRLNDNDLEWLVAAKDCTGL